MLCILQHIGLARGGISKLLNRKKYKVPPPFSFHQKTYALVLHSNDCTKTDIEKERQKKRSFYQNTSHQGVHFRHPFPHANPLKPTATC